MIIQHCYLKGEKLIATCMDESKMIEISIPKWALERKGLPKVVFDELRGRLEACLPYSFWEC
jgi:hypothetical protein